MERGYVSMYLSHVQQADKGADFDFLMGKSGAFVTHGNH
jgi:dihydroxy-acid dehydratase